MGQGGQVLRRESGLISTSALISNRRPRSWPTAKITNHRKSLLAAGSSPSVTPPQCGDRLAFSSIGLAASARKIVQMHHAHACCGPSGRDHREVNHAVSDFDCWNDAGGAVDDGDRDLCTR